MTTGGAPARPVIAARLYLRLDAQLHRNPKVGRLTDGQFRAYVTTLCEAKLARSEGEWRSKEHYAWAVGSRVARHLPALVAAGLMEVESDGWVRVHDWSDYQPKDPTAAERSKRYRDKRRQQSADRDATVTPRVTGVTERDVTPKTDQTQQTQDMPAAGAHGVTHAGTLINPQAHRRMAVRGVLAGEYQLEKMRQHLQPEDEAYLVRGEWPPDLRTQA